MEETGKEFGYGLSYTTFSISDVSLSSKDFKGSITVKATVKNTGSVAGKQVVQLYLSAPTQVIDKPAQELKGYAKTNLLNPGDAQTVTFTLTAADLASFQTDKSAWIADAGEYKVKVGTSSRNTENAVTFSLAKAIVTEKTHTALSPVAPVEELKNK